ncbi:hypothetical protein [Lysinibacillus agricola]|uniref:hypothetical protein n=1 Tax=Lysinibacillus agricola TaxID=2590012 RepID=UPI003C251C54
MEIIEFKEFEELLKSNYRSNIFESANNKVKELYDGEFKFYAKNLLNSNETVIYYFFKDFIVEVSFTFENDSHNYPFSIKEYKSKVISKELKNYHSYDGFVEINVHLDDGLQITLHNMNDSNSTWHEEYYGVIVDIFKFL